MSTILRLGLCLVLISTIMADSKIESSLLQVLNGGQTARLSISMAEGTEELLKDFDTRVFADRTDRLNTLNRELTAHATRTQAPVIRLLEKEKTRIPSISWESLWINNQIIVNGADLQLVNDIAALDSVSKIEGEKFVELLD